MIFWIIVIIFVSVFGLVLFKSINILSPNEMGVRVKLGKPGNTVDSGFHLALWPIEKIARYTKEIMEFKFAAPSIITRRGRIKGYKDPIETTEIDVICSFFCYFDINKLKITIEKAPGRTAKELGPVLVPFVQDIVRMLGARLPWRIINQERYYFIQNVQARIVPLPNGCPHILEEDEDEDGVFKYSFDSETRECIFTSEDLKNDSPFVQFGLKDVSFAIEDINFVDDGMKTAISGPEKARVEGKATEISALAEKRKRTLEGQGDAAARREMIEVIKDHKDLEFLYALREMAQGTSNTILYQIPGAFENRFKDILGDNTKVAELLRMLSPEDQKAVEKTIMDTINNLRKKSGGK